LLPSARLRTDHAEIWHLHFRRDEMASSADQLERCVLDIGHWMSANRLKLNADTTELLFASSVTTAQRERQYVTGR